MFKIKIQCWFKPFIQHYAPLKANLPQCILAFSKSLPSFSIYFLTSQGKFGLQPSEMLLFKPIKDKPLTATLTFFLLVSEEELPFYSRLIPPHVTLGMSLKVFQIKLSNSNSSQAVSLQTISRDFSTLIQKQIANSENSHNDSIISLSIESETPEKTAQDYYPCTSTVKFQPVKMKLFSIRTLNLKLVTLDFKWSNLANSSRPLRYLTLLITVPPLLETIFCWLPCHC